MPHLLNIIVADDHPLYRQGLSALLNKIPFIAKVWEASHGLEATEIIRNASL